MSLLHGRAWGPGHVLPARGRAVFGGHLDWLRKLRLRVQVRCSFWKRFEQSLEVVNRKSLAQTSYSRSSQSRLGVPSGVQDSPAVETRRSPTQNMEKVILLR